MIHSKDRMPLHFVHLELSTKCALKCSRCPRTEFAGKYKVTEMSLDFIKRVFTPNMLQKIDLFNLCGGQGDPIYNSNFIEIIKHLKNHPISPAVRIVTNGSHRSRAWWKELSAILTKRDQITFSVDGWDNESNNQYRIGSDFNSIITGIDEIAKSPAQIRWSTIIFKFNQDKLEIIKEVAKEAGAEFFDICKSTLFGSIHRGYMNHDLGYDPLEPDCDLTSKYGRYQRYTVRLKSVIENRGGLNITAIYKEKIKMYKDSYIIPLCKTRGLFYIDVEGVCYPCSWVSHPFNIKGSRFSDRVVEWKDNFFLKYRKELNLNLVSFEQMWKSKFWDILERSWKTNGGCFIECDNKCLNKYSKKHDVWRKQIEEVKNI